MQLLKFWTRVTYPCCSPYELVYGLTFFQRVIKRNNIPFKIHEYNMDYIIDVCRHFEDMFESLGLSNTHTNNIQQ